MSRPKQITVAAILLLILSLLNLASDFSSLLEGSAAYASRSDAGPYALVVFNSAVAAAGIFAAVALWLAMRWGKSLALIVSALSILNILIPVLTGQLPAFAVVVGLIFVALYLLVAVNILRYAPAPATSGP
jgi:hypothetical protein